MVMGSGGEVLLIGVYCQGLDRVVLGIVDVLNRDDLVDHQLLVYVGHLMLGFHI